MKSDSKPLILVTNDDGIGAKGLAALVAVAQGFGEVVVVAPDKPQSGMGHAITIHDPLRLVKSDLHAPSEAYACSGTPVDCVKLGIYEVLHKKPDLILSGVNHGENSSTNVLYSGTMSAAIEGAMEGQLMVENLLVLRSTARIKGDIQTMKLHIEEGAFFEGACVMRAGVSAPKLDAEPAFDE